MMAEAWSVRLICMGGFVNQCDHCLLLASNTSKVFRVRPSALPPMT